MKDDSTKQSGSHWARVRSDWYRNAARLTIRSEAFPIIWVLGLGTLVLLGNGVVLGPTAVGLLSFAGGVVTGVAFWGLWTAKEWARWVAGLLAACFGIGAALLALRGVFELLGLVESGSDPLWSRVWWTAIWFFTAAALLAPERKRLFTQAREGPPVPSAGTQLDD